MTETPARPPTSPARRAAVIVCRVLGAILVAAALAIAYADRVVFDAEAFSDRAARSLGDPRVAAYCGERIADEVIAQKRDLTAVRPLIATAARAVIGSEPFQAIFRRAAGQALRQVRHGPRPCGSSDRLAGPPERLRAA